MHRLLKRQIKHSLGKEFDINILDEKSLKLLELVTETYSNFDEEKKFLNHTVKENRKELKEAYENMVISSRLAGIGEMMENITHQWKQPLSIILNIVSLLKLDLPKNRDLKIIEDQTRYLDNTIADFKNFSSHSDDEKNLFLLEKSMEETIQIFDFQARKERIELHVDLEKGLLLNGDMGKFNQALLILFSNAKEDIVFEINDNQTVEKNLQDIISNENLHLIKTNSCLYAFKNYFKVATEYALTVIKNDVLDKNSEESAEELFLQYNRVQKYFRQLNSNIEREISFQTTLIEETSMKVIYFTIIYIIVFSLVLLFASYINYKEFNDYDIIEAQRKELSKVNRNINLSIEYASLIQEAILPTKDILDGYTKDNFVFWRPKAVVGGDIYLVVELESKNEILIMVIDGVGHGVSGAFLTILVKALEAQIVEQISRGVLEPSPAKILKYFNNSLKTILKQEKDSKSNVGFDGGVLYYNQVTNKCTYAGAKTPLYLIHDHKLEVIKSDRKSVGFIRTKMNQEYTNYDIEIKEGTKLYISTDGIIDQEGKDNRRYGKNRFENLILDNYTRAFNQQEEHLISSFSLFKDELEQSDDITVIGLEFKEF